MKCSQELDKETPVMQIEAAGNAPLPVFPAKVGHCIIVLSLPKHPHATRTNQTQLSIWNLYTLRVLCCCQSKAILTCIWIF